MPQGQVETFQQTRAAREPEFLQAFGPATYPVDELLDKPGQHLRALPRFW
jgi:hypothetical protein